MVVEQKNRPTIHILSIVSEIVVFHFSFFAFKAKKRAFVNRKTNQNSIEKVALSVCVQCLPSFIHLITLCACIKANDIFSTSVDTVIYHQYFENWKKCFTLPIKQQKVKTEIFPQTFPTKGVWMENDK